MEKSCNLCGATLEEQTTVCAQCGAKYEGVAAADKKTDDLPGKNWTKRILQSIVTVVIALGLYSYYGDAFREYHPVIAKQPEIASPELMERINSTIIPARIEGPFIIISLEEVKKNRVVRFYDPENIQEIPVLAYIAPSGRLVTSMSVSENCRSRDFYLEGEFIHCANCPSYWNASSLEAYACCQKYYPDPIPSTTLGDEVRIEIEVVRSWYGRS
jgi:hypothetical protein